MRGARAVACLLLALFVHAFVVSATHCHRAEPLGAAAAVSASGGDDVSGLGETDAHAQCLLCRLQRGFAFDLDSSPLLVGPTPGHAPASGRPAGLAPAARAFGAPSGRAPPQT